MKKTTKLQNNATTKLYVNKLGNTKKNFFNKPHHILFLL